MPEPESRIAFREAEFNPLDTPPCNLSGENGGHRVVHNFKRQPGKKEGAMGGGILMERPKPAEHFVGTLADILETHED